MMEIGEASPVKLSDLQISKGVGQNFVDATTCVGVIYLEVLYFSVVAHFAVLSIGDARGEKYKGPPSPQCHRSRYPLSHLPIFQLSLFTFQIIFQIRVTSFVQFQFIPITFACLKLLLILPSSSFILSFLVLFCWLCLVVFI